MEEMPSLVVSLLSEQPGVHSRQHKFLVLVLKEDAFFIARFTSPTLISKSLFNGVHHQNKSGCIKVSLSPDTQMKGQCLLIIQRLKAWKGNSICVGAFSKARFIKGTCLGRFTIIEHLWDVKEESQLHL